MEKKDRFVTYQIAFKFKELGFDEECFSAFRSTDGEEHLMGLDIWTNSGKTNTHVGYCSAPTWEHAVQWMWDKYKILISNEIGVFPQNFYPKLGLNVETNKVVEFNYKHLPEMWADTIKDSYIKGFNRAFGIINGKKEYFNDNSIK